MHAADVSIRRSILRCQRREGRASSFGTEVHLALLVGRSALPVRASSHPTLQPVILTSPVPLAGVNVPSGAEAVTAELAASTRAHQAKRS